MFAIMVRRADGSEQEHVFRREVIRIGRDERNDLAIEDDRVSQAHAEIVPIRGGYMIRDLDSRNGTFVNEERVREKELNNGDLIFLGGTSILFNYKRRASDTDIPGLIRHTLGELAGTSSTSVSDITVASRKKDGTAEQNHPEWDLADLARMAGWCSQDQLLEHALELLAQRVTFDAASILLRDSEGRYNRGNTRSSFAALPEPMMDLDAVRVIDKNGSCRVEDVAADGYFGEHPQAANVGSLAGAGFVCAGGTQGALYMERTTGKPAFTAEEFAILQIASEKLGSALDILWDEHRKPEQRRRQLKSLVYDLHRIHDTMQSNSELVEQALAAGDCEMIGQVWSLMQGHLDQLDSAIAMLSSALAEDAE